MPLLIRKLPQVQNIGLKQRHFFQKDLAGLCVYMAPPAHNMTIKDYLSHYLAKSLPMWRSALSTLCVQNFMNDVLKLYIGTFCIVYLDDIKIISKTEEEYHEHLRKVTKLLRDNKLYVYPEKCSFFMDEVNYLATLFLKTAYELIQGKHKW